MSEVTSTASSIRFTITGIEQLVSNFAILPRGIAYKYVQSGMRKHMQQYDARQRRRLRCHRGKYPAAAAKSDASVCGEQCPQRFIYVCSGRHASPWPSGDFGNGLVETPIAKQRRQKK